MPCPRAHVARVRRMLLFLPNVPMTTRLPTKPKDVFFFAQRIQECADCLVVENIWMSTLRHVCELTVRRGLWLCIAYLHWLPTRTLAPRCPCQY